MKTHFPLKELRAEGFFKDIKRNDFQGMADKICYFFRFKTVYEYAERPPFACHISDGDNNKPFITIIGSDINVKKAEVNLMYPNNEN